MIDATHDLPIRHQAELLEVSRSNVYYLPKPASEADLAVMRRIDELSLRRRTNAARHAQSGRHPDRAQACQHAHGQDGDRGDLPKTQHQRAASEASGQSVSLEESDDRSNHVWATDITYIPMRRGFVYLVAILDWATRKVLAHRVSISMTTDFCFEALEEAIARYGPPEIFNTERQSIHQRRLHAGADRPRHQDQHGRQGPLGR